MNQINIFLLMHSETLRSLNLWTSEEVSTLRFSFSLNLFMYTDKVKHKISSP